jgi:hypothetical protein
MSKRDVLENERLHAWFREAATLAKANGYVAIRNDSPQFKAWLGYFCVKLGWVPRFMLEAARQRPGECQVTLPLEWPLPNAPYVSAKPYHLTPDAILEAQFHRRSSREARLTLEQLKAKYGPNWGIKKMPTARQRWKPLTITDLQARGNLSEAQWDSIPDAPRKQDAEP